MRSLLMAGWVLAALWPRPAAAQERVRLLWNAPPGCPGAATVHAEVARLLGEAEPPAPGQVIDAVAEVTAGPEGGYRLSLVASQGGQPAGARFLEGESCAVVADAGALILALMIDPDAVARAQAERPVPDAGPPLSSAESGPLATDAAAVNDVADPALPVPQARPPRAPPPPPLAERPPLAAAPDAATPPITLGAGVSLAFDVGSLPAPAPGLSLGADFTRGAWRFAARLLLFPSQHGDSAAPATVGGDLYLLAAQARACRDVQAGPLVVGPCAGLELGSMRGEGTGVSLSRSKGALWVAGLLSVEGALPLAGPLGLRLALGLALPLSRPSFVVRGGGDVHQAAPVAARASLGAELRF